MDRYRGTIALLVFVLLPLFTAPVHGQGLDPASAAALSATLRALTDPAARDHAIAASPGAAEIDRQVRSLAASPQLVQEIYETAAAVFADLAASTGGDVGRMADALERARTDPASLGALLTPETMRRLRDLSSRVPDVKRSSP